MFEYKFMDDACDKMYNNEQRLNKLFTGFSAIAICNPVNSLRSE